MKNRLIPFLTLIALIWVSTGCEKQFICLKSDGTEVVQSFQLEDFSGFEVSGSGNVELSQGPLAFEVEGPQNLIDNLDLDVRNGILNIGHKKCVWKSGLMNYRITIPQLTHAGISGSGNITGTMPMEGLENVDLQISGSGDITLELYSHSISSKISGAGNITLSGEADTYTSKISGSGDIRCFELPVKTCELKVSGSGNHEVQVSEELDVDISGSGDVRYKGYPGVTTSISGSGNLIDAN